MMVVKMIVTVAMLLPMAAAATDSVARNETVDTNNSKVAGNEAAPKINGTSSASLRAAMTCDNYPRVCWVPGSPGPDCCRKKCVNVERDVNNCGRCRRRCRYGEVCCGGSCRNIVYDPNNCGGCGNRCGEGGYCRHGMCDYA